MKISLRPVTPDDRDFRWNLLNAAMRDYIHQTWGWDDEWQRNHFAETFGKGAGKVITVNGSDAGYMLFEEGDDIYLASIELLPEFQNRGIGTRLIKDLIASGRPVRLQVLKVNPALRLYERLGFEIAEDMGTHYEMRRDASLS